MWSHLDFKITIVENYFSPQMEHSCGFSHFCGITFISEFLFTNETSIWFCSKYLSQLYVWMHIICNFRFNTYHNTYFQFSKCNNNTNLQGNPHEPWNITSPSKDVIYFYIDQFSNRTNPMWGSFVEDDQCLVYVCLRIGKQKIKLKE